MPKGKGYGKPRMRRGRRRSTKRRVRRRRTR